MALYLASDAAAQINGAVVLDRRRLDRALSMRSGKKRASCWSPASSRSAARRPIPRGTCARSPAQGDRGRARSRNAASCRANSAARSRWWPTRSSARSPALVICLGQAGGRARTVRRARRRSTWTTRASPTTPGAQPVDEPIAANGPAGLLRHPAGEGDGGGDARGGRAGGGLEHAPAPSSATTCMYGVLHFLAASGCRARAGFIHVPYCRGAGARQARHAGDGGRDDGARRRGRDRRGRASTGDDIRARVKWRRQRRDSDRASPCTTSPSGPRRPNASRRPTSPRS